MSHALLFEEIVIRSIAAEHIILRSTVSKRSTAAEPTDFNQLYSNFNFNEW